MWLTISLYITGELWGCKIKSVDTIEGKYNVLNDFIRLKWKKGNKKNIFIRFR